MGKLFSIKPPLTIKGRTFKGLRGWSGKPLHPPLTDIPVAAYLLVGLFDVISYVLASSNGGEANGGAERDFFGAGTYVIVAGAIASVGAALTGFWDRWRGIEREPSSGVLGRAKHTQVWRTMNWHMAVMLTVTAIVVVDIVVRLAGSADHATLPTMILSVLAAALVSYGAVYGGALVYDYQFNVESLEGSTAWDETEVDQMPADHPKSAW